MDRARDNSYVPPPARMILTRLTTQIDPESQEVMFKQQYIGGDIRQDSHVMTPFMDGLTKGVYVAIFQAEFTE